MPLSLLRYDPFPFPFLTFVVSLDATAKTKVGLGTDRPHVFREAIMCCRKGGSISMPGVYFGFLDKIPMGAFMNKGLTLKTGQTHVHRDLKPLMELIENGQIDPSAVITHCARLADAPEMYEIFRDKQDGCIKVVLMVPQTFAELIASSNIELI